MHEWASSEIIELFGLGAACTNAGGTLHGRLDFINLSVQGEDWVEIVATTDIGGSNAAISTNQREHTVLL